MVEVWLEGSCQICGGAIPALDSLDFLDFLHFLDCLHGRDMNLLQPLPFRVFYSVELNLIFQGAVSCCTFKKKKVAIKSSTPSMFCFHVFNWNSVAF